MSERTTSKEVARFVLPAQVRTRAPYLLPMCYTLSELAHRLEIELQLVQGWLAYGMPRQRDHRGRVWVDGIAFARWVQQVSRRRPQLRLAQGEVYCSHCRKVVVAKQPTVKRQGRSRWLESQCPTCGGIVRRILGKRRYHPRLSNP